MVYYQQAAHGFLMAANIHTTEPVPVAAGGMFRALRHRNYRLFWGGALLSNAGTWMQALAQGYLVYELTRSPFWLGLDGFMATFPGLALTLVGGVFADWFDRRRLLLLTQIGAGFSALALAALVYTGAVQVWMILALSFLTGCCMAFAGPSFHAIMLDLVGREDLPNAIALNSAQFQFSRIVGPSLAGVALRYLGAAACFLVNGLSFVAVIIGLCLLRLPDGRRHETDEARRKNARAVWEDLAEGWRYVQHRPRVFWLLLVNAVGSFFGAPYLSQIPHYARDILHAGETGLSLMMAMSGAGAFCGALTLAFAGDFRRKGWAILCCSFAFGAGVVVFALSGQLELTLLALFLMGFAGVGSFAVTNTLVQQLVTDDMRGRVMSMLILTFVGSLPFSNLLAGVAAERFGAPRTLAVGGCVVMLFASLVTLGNRRLRESG
jgi:MFS family permease